MNRKVYFNFILLQLFLFLYIAYSYLFTAYAYPVIIILCMIIETISSFYFFFELNKLFKKDVQYWKELARLERLNLLGQMSASLAHEIKNPLTTVRGFLQIFQNKEQYKDDTENIKLLISELDRCKDIINNFLSISKVGRTNSDKICNVNYLIKEIFPLIKAQALETNKNIVLKLDDELNKILVNIDKDEFKQVLFNLVKNGLEANAEKEKVTIKSYKKNNYAVISIQDKGIGIPQKLRKKIGTPFFTTKKDGTGLGLSICYNIIEKYKGRISFDTNENGTIFYVYLPVM